MGGEKTKPVTPTDGGRQRADSHVRCGVDVDAGHRGATAANRPASSVPPPGADNSGVRPLPEFDAADPVSASPSSASPLERAVRNMLDSAAHRSQAQPPKAAVSREPSPPIVHPDDPDLLELPSLPPQPGGSPLQSALRRAAEGFVPPPRAKRDDRVTPRELPSSDGDQRQRAVAPPERRPAPPSVDAAPPRVRSARKRADAVDSMAPLLGGNVPIPRPRARRQHAATPRAYPGQRPPSQPPGALTAQPAPETAQPAEPAESNARATQDVAPRRDEPTLRTSAPPVTESRRRRPRARAARLLIAALLVVVAYLLWPAPSGGAPAAHPAPAADR